MTVLLYGRDLSHYVMSVRRMLEFKGIPYDFEYVPYHDPMDLLAVSGQDYVPYLLWEDKGVAWYDIPDFLEAKKPTPTFYPGGSRNLARILEGWAHETIEEAVWKYVIADTPAVYKDPKERWVFIELQERRRGPLEHMAARKAEFAAALVEALQDVEARLSESPYLLGKEPSLADFGLYGALTPIEVTKNEFPKALPKTHEWYRRVGSLKN